MRFAIVTVMIFTYSLFINCQNHIPDMALEHEFDNQVKSVDEFMARFNGEETRPDSVQDSISRRNSILSLFDFKISHDDMSDDDFRCLLSDFVDEVLLWDGKLSISSDNTYAEALCKIKFKGKYYHVTLFLKRELSKNGGNKWAVSDVKGLSALGLYNDRRMTISPVDHETHFMSLQDIFQSNSQFIPAIRSNNKKIDELSFFFGLCVANAIDFVQVDSLKFHFLDVPDFVFMIEEIGREGNNSGWLITRLIRLNDSEKEKYINLLLGQN